jgi:hypothetical protein
MARINQLSGREFGEELHTGEENIDVFHGAYESIVTADLVNDQDDNNDFLCLGTGGAGVA